MLIEVAGRLSSTLRAQDALAREGGDESLDPRSETDREQAALLAARVRDSLTATAAQASSGLSTTGA